MIIVINITVIMIISQALKPSLPCRCAPNQAWPFSAHPHHHSEKASPSLQVKSKMGQLKFKTSTLTFNRPRKFLPNERKRKTAQKHTWSSSACWRCPTAAIEAGFSSPVHTCFRPLCAPHSGFCPLPYAQHTGFRHRRRCSLHIRGSVSQGIGWFWVFDCYIFFLTKCRLKHVGVC